jgi:hypothetical protein
MLWRKFKLDWTYAIGELAIVTVGVLIALAVDQWNSDRLAGIEEAAYVSRLMNNINEDIRQLEKAKTLRTSLDNYLGTFD